MNIETNHSHNISLSLQPQGTVSGNVLTGETVHIDNLGNYSFTGLYILSSGSFIIVASCPGANNGLSSLVNITNYIKSLAITNAATNIMAFEYFNVDFNITGDDNNLFILDALIILNDSQQKLGGDNFNISTQTGNGNFEVYGKLSGVTNLTVSTNNTIESSVVSATISQAVLKIGLTPSVIYIQTINSEALFDISIGVYNSSDLITTLANSLQVNLSISCAYGTNCSGTSIIPSLQSGTITNGIYHIYNESIKSYGNFSINGTVNDMKMASVFTGVVINNVKNITLTPTSTNISVYVSDLVNVSIIGDDDNAYIPTCLLKITDQNKTLAERNVTDVFEAIDVYVNAIGNANLTGVCNGVSSNVIAINANKLSLKIVSNTMISVIFI